MIMQTLNFGAKFTTPLSKEAIKFVGCSFVNDTDLIQTGLTPEMPTSKPFTGNAESDQRLELRLKSNRRCPGAGEELHISH